MKKILFIAVLFSLCTKPSSASHLMGGSLTYQFLFLDTASNQNHYRVRLQLFRDCSSAVQLPNPIDLGVYSQDTANPGADKILYNTFLLNRDSLQFIVPPSPGDSCSFSSNVCVQEGDYHVDIVLGASSGGFHLMVQLNARNAAITNLDNPGTLGQTYYAFIPPSSINNSSPVFSDVPVPFICTSDTISIVNLATDVDNDSLVYSFVVPYNSYTNGNPTPPPPVTISVPPPIVPYNTPTYSFAQPFGPGGFLSIDSVSGLTQYYIPNTGFYVVCVQIDEYRNGILIATTRRDLQLIAITCPVNPTPVLSNTGGSGQTVYNIIEGSTLCFPVTISDPNGDSIYVHASGSLFDSTIVNPHATLPDTSGQPTITTQFCWSTGCFEGRVAPYQFNVSALDNGCPPKTANIVYSIYVHPFVGPSVISGPDSVCNQQTSVAYSVPNAAGNTFHWSVTNGTQVSGGTTSNITIDWGNATSGTIHVYAVSPYGCTHDTISKTVVLKALPASDAGSDVSFCSGQTVGIGASTTAGYTYSWNPVTGLDNSTISNPTVTLTNGTTSPVTNPYVVTVSNNGCSSKDTTLVTVRPLPISPAINDRASCSGDTVYLGAAFTTGYTYVWSPSSGLDSTSVSNPFVVVSNLTSSDDTLVYYVSTTLSACVTNDTVSIIVHPLPSVSATSNPDSICVGDIATLTGHGANIYSWATSLSPGTSIGFGPTINVSPTLTTTYIVTGTSSTTGCKNTNTVTLFESPLPPVVATASPDSVCLGGSSTITATGATSYWWATLALPNDTVGTGSTLTVTPSSAVTYILTGTNAVGCVNKDTVTLALNPAALTDSIYGTRSLCPGVTGVGYVALPVNNTSTYQWLIQSGTITGGQGTDTVYADWDTLSGPGSISVIETTDHGCISDTVVLAVNINTILTPASPFGITPICEENADSAVYTTFNTPGSVYTWGAINGTIISANGTNTIAINWDSTGTGIGIVWYQEHSTTADTNCYGISDTLFVTIHARPVTSLITGTTTLCAFDTGNVYLVSPDAGSTFAWSITTGTISSGNGTNAIHVNWGQAGTDTVRVIQTNSFGCVGIPVDTTILLHSLPTVIAGPGVPLCTGDSIQLNAQSGASFGYLWTPSTNLSSTVIHNPFASPTATTEYTVQVTDLNGCKNKDSLLVTVNALPNADAGADTSICFGIATTLNASGGIHYVWTPSIGLNNDTLHNPSANPAATTVYYVNVTDANNCHLADSVLVTVLTLPTANAGPDTILCHGSSIQLQASGGVSYLWSPASNLDNSHISNPISTTTSPITYTVTVTDANNCRNTDAVFVDVNAMPHSDFSFGPVIGCSGLEIKLINTSTNELNHLWLFGDGTSQAGSAASASDTVTHLYPYGNTTIIRLVAINNFCMDTMSLEKPDIGIGNALDSLPNVFTPNNDGLNDCFQISPNGGLSDCAILTIFNRWGEIVYEGSTSSHCWNGKNKNGNDCAEGVYFFVVKVGNATKNGSVQLIRK